MGSGEVSGGPQGDQVFEAGEEACEEGVDEQVQRGQHCALQGEAIGLGLEIGAQGGDVLGQGGLNKHTGNITNQ